jgi:hypothetical protein
MTDDQSKSKDSASKSHAGSKPSSAAQRGERGRSTAAKPQRSKSRASTGSSRKSQSGSPAPRKASGRSSSSRASSGIPKAVTTVGKKAARAGRRAGESVVETGSEVGESAKAAASKIGKSAGLAGKRVGEFASDAGSGIAGTSKYLAAGALAGALIGTAFERLRNRDETSGESGRDGLWDQTRDALARAAEFVTHMGEAALQRVEALAGSQGEDINGGEPSSSSDRSQGEPSEDEPSGGEAAGGEPSGAASESLLSASQEQPDEAPEPQPIGKDDGEPPSGSRSTWTAPGDSAEPRISRSTSGGQPAFTSETEEVAVGGTSDDPQPQEEPGEGGDDLWQRSRDALFERSWEA